MRPHRIIAVLFVAVCILIGSTAQASDFEQLFKAVDKLEANLKKLIESETAERKNAIARLESKIADVPTNGASAEPDPRIARLAEHLKSLAEQVAQLSAAQEPSDRPAGTGVSEETILELVNDIAFLKAENQYLRGLVEQNNTELASLNGGFVPPQNADDERMVALTQRITDLKDRIAEYTADRHHTEPVAHDGATTVGNFSLTGFVDAANYTDFSAGESEFSVEQVEVDVINRFSDRASLQADIEFVDDHHGGFEFQLEQGFLWYRTSGATSFTFGKFNAPIGYEGVDPVDMYQYSAGLPGSLGLPGNLTGLMFTAEFGIAEWSTYVVNGWDVNADNNKEKTFGTRLGITPAPIFTFGLSAISGAELDDNNSSRRSVADIDWLVTPSQRLIIGGEFLYGVETKALPNDEKASFYGGLLMSHVALGERVGLTGRVSYFDDQDGVRTGHSQALTEFTLSPSVEIVHGFEGLFELRYDISDEETFENSDGGHTDSRLSTAIEFVYGF